MPHGRPFCALIGALIWLGVLLWPGTVCADPSASAVGVQGSETRQVIVTVAVDPRLPDLAAARLVVSTRSGELATAEPWVRWSEAEISVRSPADLRVPADRRVLLELAAGGDIWSNRLVLPPGVESIRAGLQVFPAATLTGSLMPDPGLALPLALDARILPSAEAGNSSSGGGRPSFPATDIVCPIETISDRARFSCSVPAVEVDVRLAADGLMPHYLWGLAPGVAEVESLGALRLRVGGSISGWVVPLRGARAQTTVFAEPQISGWLGDPAAKTRFAARRIETTPDDRGFFQLGPLAEGAYTLVATQAGALQATRSDIAVGESSWVELEEAITLREPLAVDFVLAPPTDPQGEPWLVSLAEPSPTSSTLRPVAEGPATVGGFFRAEGVAPGRHRFVVTALDGSRWLSDSVEIEPTNDLLVVEIPHVAMAGRVLRGGDGVEASLVFGSTQGALRVAVSTDDDGRFEGFLPRSGTWPVDLLDPAGRVMAALDPVEVDEGPGGVPARLMIELPDTELQGRVLDGDGTAVAGASLLVVRTGADARRESMVETDEDGRFSLLGLEPGALQLQAYDGERSSAWQTVEVEDSAEQEPLELVLRSKRKVQGTIVARGGPVPGAQLIFQPEGPAVAGIERVVADAGGRFELQVDQATTALNLLVDAPGFALGLHWSPVPSDGPLLLQVSTEFGALDLLAGGGVSEQDPSVQSPSEQSRPSPSSTLRSNLATFSLGTLVALLRSSGRIDAAPGRLVLPSLAPGIYSWCPDALSTGCSSTLVQSGGRALLRLETPEPSGSTIGGAP